MLLTILLLMQSPSLQAITAERQKSRALAMVKWQDCTKSNSLRLAAKTREPAATIADAALGICASHERDVRFWTGEIVKAIDDADEFARAFTAERRAELRGKAIADVIEARAK